MPERTPEFDDDNNLVVRSPCFELNQLVEDEEISLTWFNTVIRVFPDPQFNHLEYTTESGTKVGLRVEQAFMDVLMENEFPYYSMPYVDGETMEWLVQNEMNKAEEFF